MPGSSRCGLDIIPLMATEEALPVDAESSPIRISCADSTRRRYVNSIETSSCPQNENCCSSQNTPSTSLVPIKKSAQASRFITSIPCEILNDSTLNDIISRLPSNYNFEIHKSVWQVKKAGAQSIALQLPEGLQRYALILSDIHVKFAGCKDAIIMGDVTYGACCIDDYTAQLLGCDMIIHYGHSCLVPVTTTKIPVLYIFVEISIPPEPLVETLRTNFLGKKLALMSTVQYVATLYAVKTALDKQINMFIPQIKPLSPGEVLGCTAPRLPSDTDALVFVADGRFHLEAAMIANPTIVAYRYDPFTQRVFEESYDHPEMLRIRNSMIALARNATSFGIILGTLGRQGNTLVLDDIIKKLEAAGKETMVFLMSEVRPSTLQQYPDIQVWVQTSCPRLSIDWNYTFDIPLLTPYELNVALGIAQQFNETPDGSYPMDFYATGDTALISGPWAPGYNLRPPRKNKPIS